MNCAQQCVLLVGSGFEISKGERTFSRVGLRTVRLSQTIVHTRDQQYLMRIFHVTYSTKYVFSITALAYRIAGYFR